MKKYVLLIAIIFFISMASSKSFNLIQPEIIFYDNPDDFFIYSNPESAHFIQQPAESIGGGGGSANTKIICYHLNENCKSEVFPYLLKCPIGYYDSLSECRSLLFQGTEAEVSEKERTNKTTGIFDIEHYKFKWLILFLIASIILISFVILLIRRKNRSIG